MGAASFFGGRVLWVGCNGKPKGHSHFVGPQFGCFLAVSFLRGQFFSTGADQAGGEHPVFYLPLGFPLPLGKCWLSLSFVRFSPEVMCELKEAWSRFCKDSPRKSGLRTRGATRKWDGHHGLCPKGCIKAIPCKGVQHEGLHS